MIAWETLLGRSLAILDFRVILDLFSSAGETNKRIDCCLISPMGVYPSPSYALLLDANLHFTTLTT